MNEAIQVSADRKLLALLFLFIGSMYALTASGSGFGYEGLNILQAQAYWNDRLVPGPGGRIHPYTPGGVLDVAAYLPFTILKAAAIKAHLPSSVVAFAYVLTRPFYALITCFLFFGLARDSYRCCRTAALLTIVLALGTMFWPYSKFGMETQQTLWTLAGIWSMVRYHNNGTIAAALAFGVSLAALPLTKITGSVHALALIVAAGWLILQQKLWQRPKFWIHFCLVAVVCGIGAAGFLWSNKARFGGYFLGTRYGNHAGNPLNAIGALAALLFSPGKTIFVFNPILLIAVLFLPGFWRRFYGLRVVMICFVPVIIMHLGLVPWTDETWGPRRLHFVVPLLLMPLGMMFESESTRRAVGRITCRVILGLSIIVQLIACLFSYTALAYTLQNSAGFHLENMIWNPQYNAIRFNTALLESNIAGQIYGTSDPYVIRHTYLPWAMTDNPHPNEVFDLSKHNHLDTWYFKQSRDWAGSYWFVKWWSYLVMLLVLCAVGSAFGLLAVLQRRPSAAASSA